MYLKNKCENMNESDYNEMLHKIKLMNGISEN